MNLIYTMLIIHGIRGFLFPRYSCKFYSRFGSIERSRVNRNIASYGQSWPTKSSTVLMQSDTIYALSSGSITVTGVAVVRISGPLADLCLSSLLLSPIESQVKEYFPEPRKALLKNLYCPNLGDKIDRGLVLWFPAPRSFTGEDVIELHIHGSRAVIISVFAALEHIDRLLQLIKADESPPSTGRDSAVWDLIQQYMMRKRITASQFGNIRPAERGEFTRRAFESGKMDLTEVEGLADLLAADTAEQRKQALRQMDGYLRQSFDKWRLQLLQCLAHSEAVIDFGDDDREDSVDASAVMAAIVPQVRQLREELRGHLRDCRRGEIVREGVRIVLGGPPNAGKSSLLNALARRPAAIVSPVAGTTRDVLEVRLDLAGVPCLLSDTAGLRGEHCEQEVDAVEVEGMRRARAAFEQAHLRLFVVDASSSEQQGVLGLLQSLLDSDKTAATASEDEGGAGSEGRLLVVANKVDLLQNSSSADQQQMQELSDWLRISGRGSATLLQVSCATGAGLAELEETLACAVADLIGGSDSAAMSEGPLITRERHRRHLLLCAASLDRFLDMRLPMDAAAEEIRLAMLELGKVTGRVDVEELLDVIFRDFCIGK